MPAPLPIADAPPPPDDQTLLNALRRTGLRFVQSIDSALDAEPTPAELARLAAAYDRTGRGIRRTIAFCKQLQQPARDPVKRAADRRHIIRTVEDAISRSRDATEADALRAELYERLESTELDEDLDSLPADTVAASILRDFGLANVPFTAPYPRRTPSHIAAISARAAGRPVPPVTKQPEPPNPQPHNPQPPNPEPPYPEPPNPAEMTVEAFLAWDKSRRRARPLGP